MDKVSRLKGGGYLTSVASVILLAIPAFKSALESVAMTVSLTGGVVLSILGMAFRWRSHRIDQHRKTIANDSH